MRTQGRRFDCGAFLFLHFRHPAAPTPDAATRGIAGDGAGPRPGARLPRLGVVASRAAIGNAVRRNRAKRLLREVFRHHQHLVPAGVDLLLVSRSPLNRLEYAEIERKFIDACRRVFPPAKTAQADA